LANIWCNSASCRENPFKLANIWFYSASCRRNPATLANIRYNSARCRENPVTLANIHLNLAQGQPITANPISHSPPLQPSTAKTLNEQHSNFDNFLPYVLRKNWEKKKYDKILENATKSLKFTETLIMIIYVCEKEHTKV